ncbi:MAG: MoxR family ATPase [Clostridia bacterium]|nr:MoxR family ATPase [Clostridia bacterium]
MEKISSFAQSIQKEIGKAVVGKQEAVEDLLIALLCEGHVLLEDVPGIGKTTLALALSRSLGLDFRRIQFTPDVLPGDVTGFTLFDPATGEMRYREGAIMGQIILADEINRASPKTQSALLEAMQERQVTVDGQTHPLPHPFLVLATQNPIEYAGTFPLPEAQLDRFMLRLNLGYPSLDEEAQILNLHGSSVPLQDVEAVLSPDDLAEYQQLCLQVHVIEEVRYYIAALCQRTRHHPDLQLGASPRATLALYQASKAYALLKGRNYVVPDDVKHMAPKVLCHRLFLTHEARQKETSVRDVLDSLLATVPVPVLTGK